jgi:hypothetical protein
LVTYLSLTSFLWCNSRSLRHSLHPAVIESCYQTGPPPCLHDSKWYPCSSIVRPHSHSASQFPKGIGLPSLIKATKRNSLGSSASLSEDGVASSHEPLSLPWIERRWAKSLGLEDLSNQDWALAWASDPVSWCCNFFPCPIRLLED